MKTSFDSIFEELKFTEEERSVFLECIEEVKIAQEEGGDPVSDIVKMVRGLRSDEV